MCWNIWWWGVEKGDVWNDANKSAHGTEKPKTNRNSLHDYCLKKAPIFVGIYILFAFLELRPHVDVVECGVFQLQAEFYSPFATFFMLFHGHWCYGGFDYLSERRRYSARSVCVLTPLNRITSCRASWLFVPLTRWKIHFPLVAMTIITKNFIFR